MVQNHFKENLRRRTRHFRIQWFIWMGYFTIQQGSPSMQLLTQIQPFLDVVQHLVHNSCSSLDLWMMLVSDFIFQVYDILEHLDTRTVCFSCDPIEEKNMFNLLRSVCREPTWWTTSRKGDCLDRLPCCIRSYLIHTNHWIVMFLFSVDTVFLWNGSETICIVPV